MATAPKSSWLLQLTCCAMFPSSAAPLNQLLILSSGTETAEAADVDAALCAWGSSPGSLASSAAQLGKCSDQILNAYQILDSQTGSGMGRLGKV